MLAALDHPDSATTVAAKRATLMVDAHVHLYGSYDLADSFDHARANFDRAVSKRRLPSDTVGVLLLVEMSYEHRFAELAAIARSGTPIGRWTFQPTEEAMSLVVRDDAGRTMVLIAGRQIVTRERLEVLAIGTTATFPDQLNLDAAMEAAFSSRALVALPFAVGKWTGARGRLIREAIERHRSRGLVLGDNGNRLKGWPAPGVFARAWADGIPVLPGSDPLPLPGQLQRIASYGLVLDAVWRPHAPARPILDALAALDEPPRTFGSLTGPVAFFGAQTRMQLRRCKK